MRVLSVASECVPLVKTGGLADVAGALPGALRGVGVEMRTLLPGYPAVMAALEAGAEAVGGEDDLFGGPARVLAAEAGGLDLLVLDAPHLYSRPGGIYLDVDGRDWPDNPERFAALSWIGARLAAEGVPAAAGRWRPQVLHGHDWQAGLAPWYLRQIGAAHRVASVLTIHNIAFTGPAPAERGPYLRLDPAGYTTAGYEFYGRISALKAGLVAADRIATVSPGYARELMTPEGGMGLDGVLRAREGAVAGILNGIDTALWNPAADPAVAAYDRPEGKAPARAALIAEYGLDAGATGPLCVVIARLTEQKGLDLLRAALPALLDRGGQLAVLGAGDAGLEAAWREAGDHYRRVGVRIGYDESLSHRMVAGADAILVPSRFEPCGLTQLMGLRYGAIPLVTRVGGLADTVIHANAAACMAGVATGLQVHPPTPEALGRGLADLCALYEDAALWLQMQRNAMRHPVGWQSSADAYAALYAGISRAA